MILDNISDFFLSFVLCSLDMTDPIKITLIVKDFNIPTKRLDVWATEAIKASLNIRQDLDCKNLSLSRSRIKKLIESNFLYIDKIIVNDPSLKINNHKIIDILIPDPEEAKPLPEKIKLDILYEDQFIIVINKAAGIVVHPAPGSPKGTLVNALLYHCGESLRGIGGVKRPGIVHRLDKNTSGVMVVAKTELSHARLCDTFMAHDLDRRYNALVWRQPESFGYIEKPIGRSNFDRKKMAISSKGKMAITKWKVLEVYHPLASLIECKLETGRTHQIRVHLADLGHSVIGDQTYGRPTSQKKIIGEVFKEKVRQIKLFKRQALHAVKLSFNHPITNKYLEFNSPLPNDIQQLIGILKNPKF